MAANVLNMLGKLTKKRTAEENLREDNMAPNDQTAATKERTPEEKAATRAQKREGRAQRASKRKEKVAEGSKPMRLCSLATVEVKKGSDGFHVAVNGSAGRKSFTIAPNEAVQMLRDLDTAVHVMRSQM